MNRRQLRANKFTSAYEREQVSQALLQDERRSQVQKYGTPEQRGCSRAEGEYEAYLVWSAIKEAWSKGHGKQ